MAETLTPNQKRRTSISSRLQSPTSPFILGSNDDKLERAQARAKRAAAIRRVIVEDDIVQPPPSPSNSSCLDGDQIIELFRNCIKLASENKINQKNTWELDLIDHLSEIVKVDDEKDAETNFQKASCSLEAGVKIYAVRVDSVHSEAFKVLGGISRAGLEDPQVEGDNGSNEQDLNQSKKDSEKKISPLSTLESSFEALNVKKLDVAFAVDPLYHQTTAQFDEGGAKGLLLNNLGIFGGCRVLFDSEEVPAKCISSIKDTNSSNFIDISFASECIEQMVMNVKAKKEICPTFTAIVEQLDDYNLEQRKNQRTQEYTCDVDAADLISAELNEGLDFTSVNDGDGDDNGCELDQGSYENAEAWSFDHNDEAYQADDSFDINDQHFENQYEEQEASMSNEADVFDRFGSVASLLMGISGISSSQNAWAGPEHWKFRKSKTVGTESVGAQDTELGTALKKKKTKKAAEADINLTKVLDEGIPNIFAPPKSLKSLLLPAKKVPCSNKLPEDCHYHPEDLVKLFLLPNVMCLGKRRKRVADEGTWKEGSGFGGSSPLWDNEGAYSGPDDDGYAHSDIEEQDVLVSQPRQVKNIEVHYDKTAKQVDVHLLKETLWDHLHGFVEAPELEAHEESISFKQVLAAFPDDCGAAAAQDISPHLCFICLLHLANEHGLAIQGCTNMDDLSIHLPVSSQETDCR